MAGILTLENVVLALVFVAVGLAVLAFLNGRPTHLSQTSLQEDTGLVVLFEGNAIIDSSPDVAGRIDRGQSGNDWAALHDRLALAYPDFPASPDDLPASRQATVPPRRGLSAGPIRIERFDTVARVTLARNSLTLPPIPSSNNSELDTLRIAMDATPYPVWRSGPEGAVFWHNAAYAALARKIRGRDADLTSPLFDSDAGTVRRGRKTRVSVSPPNQDQKYWLDVTRVRQDGGDLFYAVDANTVVDAETAQRNFVQTLAKTFAQLPIGLAIFDRNRQLALFNPAVIDLTSLPADFLSARPTLFSFFDRLRDLQIMPEPKDYASWRQQMADLAAAAADGRYQETWSLPSGPVYSVSGRPHPDGAIAFLIEDITAEITLTRRFRAELELGQAILDRMDEAIAVFASDGTLLYSNEPFHALWGLDPDRSFAQFTVIEATRAWQENCAPTPVWGELRDFVATRENRADWWAEAALRSGHNMKCGVQPIQNGSTLVRFFPLPDGLLAPDERKSQRIPQTIG